MRDLKILIAIGSLLLIGYVVMQYNKPKPVNWQVTLSYTDKIPFGTYILRHQLDDLFPGGQVINTNSSLYASLKPQARSGNYVIISKRLEITKYDYAALVKYVSAGNTVFMSAMQWGTILNDTLKLGERYDYSTDSNAVKFISPQLNNKVAYTFGKDMAPQYFFDFDTARATVICRNKAGYATYLRYRFGKGSLLLCANPKAFSNYALLSSAGVNYAQDIFSYLPAAKNIYWDSFQNGDVEEYRSPMRVVLGSPALRSAYYIALAALFLYVVFEMKRRQRIIPVIEPLANTSVAFVNTIGQLYFEQRDNANIAQKKVNYFLEYIRARYSLNTTMHDPVFMEALAKKSGVELSLIKEIFYHVGIIQSGQPVSDHDLLMFNQRTEQFYSLSA